MLVMNKSMVLPHVVFARETLRPLSQAVWERTIVLWFSVCVSVMALKFVQVGEYLVAARFQAWVLFLFIFGWCPEQIN